MPKIKIKIVCDLLALGVRDKNDCLQLPPQILAQHL